MNHSRKLSVPVVQVSQEQLAQDFFQRSVGQWLSKRRYYTLQSGDVKEVVSHIGVELLPAGCDELVELARLHHLDGSTQICCGARSSWDSHDTAQGRRQSRGSTVFGICGSLLLRDRGFDTPNPVTATYTMRGADTMTLRTEYEGSSFEEELRLIGTQYRTRQTVISRAGEEIMIGQYLETRVPTQK
jgi:hypothetical protein